MNFKLDRKCDVVDEMGGDMRSDIEIAQSAKMQSIVDIGKKLGICEEDLDLYGKYKAKLNLKFSKQERKAKLVLVSAMSPTAFGEGKTTVSVGLSDSLNRIGKNTVVALREPSLGPVFGVKGGAAGGGYAQVVPMEDINLHFTGDFHAIGAAHNLISAMLDNHIHHGNALDIDVNSVLWKRVVDMNDRALRQVVIGLGSKLNGIPRQEGYDITVASEIMAILALSTDLTDLKERISNIIIAYNRKGEAVYVRDLNAQGAVTALLKDAIKPNLVQTLEGNPAIIHAGPFANIAHGCNSVIATKSALALADYVVTEAGFGADLGAEKFLDIKCRAMGIHPDAVVIVASIRALYQHSFKDEKTLDNLKAGFSNLRRHILNMKEVFGLHPVVAINQFHTDTDEELSCIIEECAALGVKAIPMTSWGEGSKGGVEVAKEVVAICEEENRPVFRYAYEDNLKIEDKMRELSEKIYGAKGVEYSTAAKKQLKKIAELGFDYMPICVAKTQYSFSDDKDLLGAPEDFVMNVQDIRISAGAGFIVMLCGSIMTMPGLPKVPAAEKIDIDADGNISGLY